MQAIVAHGYALLARRRSGVQQIPRVNVAQSTLMTQGGSGLLSFLKVHAPGAGEDRDRLV
jgi:hypothetical protein